MTKTLIPDTLMNLPNILKEDSMRALRGWRDIFQTSAKTHHETLYETIAFIVAFVLHLQQFPDDRNEFLTDDYWDGKPQTPKEKNLTRLAVMFVVGAKQSDGALYQQALQYTKIARHFLTLDIEPAEIPEELRRKPIYKLLDELKSNETEDDEADEASGHSPARPKAAPTDAAARSNKYQDGDDLNDDNNRRGDEEDDDDGDLGKSARPTSGNDRNPATDAAKTKEKCKRYPFKQDRELAVEAEDFFKMFFDMNQYKEIPAMIRRLPDEDGWAKFEITNLLDRREYRFSR